MGQAEDSSSQEDIKDPAALTSAAPSLSISTNSNSNSSSSSSNSSSSSSTTDIDNIMKHNSRRRPHDHPASAPTTLLEVERHRGSSCLKTSTRDYFTFQQQHPHIYRSTDKSSNKATYLQPQPQKRPSQPGTELFIAFLLFVPLPWKHAHHPCHYLWPWKIMTGAIFFVSFTAYHCMGRRLYLDFDPEWEWDRNVYNPRQQHLISVSSNRSQPFTFLGGPAITMDNTNNNNRERRNLLIAQVVGGNDILKELGEICSRPNRAYAHQWGLDYVRFSKPAKKLVRSCFDKVGLLSSILERQLPETIRKESGNWMQPPRVVYDAVALFPPDAIITDLDDDLLNLLPQDKLLAIAGWDIDSDIKNSNFADVLFVNLKHNYAETVIKLWLSMVEPPVTCGAGNDLSMLLEVVESVLDDNQDLSSVVVSLDENRQGTIGNNAIKVIPLKVPGPKAPMLVSSHTESKAILQSTADSVCYRYYPKCEVL